MGPAQTSGGLLNELRINAAVFASLDTDSEKAKALPAVMLSADLHNSSSFAVGESTPAMPASPSTFSANRIFFPSGSHASHEAEAFMPGVRFFNSPPASLTRKMVPPVRPSSPIHP